MSSRYVHELRVRYHECDPQGVVFNGWYLFYYDIALTEFHRETLGKYEGSAAAGYEIVSAEASIRYRASARFDELMRIELVLSRIGTTSFTVNALFRVGERLVATAEVRHVIVERKSGEKAPIPAGARARLEQFADASGSGSVAKT